MFKPGYRISVNRLVNGSVDLDHDVADLAFEAARTPENDALYTSKAAELAAKHTAELLAPVSEDDSVQRIEWNVHVTYEVKRFESERVTHVPVRVHG